MIRDGSQQNIADVGDTNSPIVNPTSIKIVFNYAAIHRNYVMSTIDFDYAFLLQLMKKVKDFYIQIPKEVAAIWVR